MFQKLKLYMRLLKIVGTAVEVVEVGREGGLGVEGNKVIKRLLAEVGRGVRLLSR